MANDNLSAPAEPVATSAPTEESLIEDISNLLEPPETEQPEEHEEPAAAPAEDDDPLGLEAEAVEQDDADDPDGPDPEIKGGRFAPDTAKVTLDDGTVTTIAELKRGTLFQRDYTKKTQELSEEKRSVEAQRAEVSQYAQQLDQSREYLAWYAENFLPKQPEPFNGAPDDYVGFLEWQRKQAEWQTHAQAYQSFQQQKQQEAERKNGETQKQANERLAKERNALLQAIPVLKDPVKGKATWEAIVSGAQQHYGITAEEVNTVGDHRMLLALRDALAYRRIKAAAPKVQAEVGKRPPLKEGRRAPPNQAQVKAKQERLERLKRDPSLANGAASLMDFDL